MSFLSLFQGDASRSDTDDDMSSDYGDEDKLRELLNSGVCVCVRVFVHSCLYVFCYFMLISC